jgi:mRNA-degrading endonuclease RelE of RelBE toxin-antitoxin system
MQPRMTFQILFTQRASDELRSIRKNEQRKIIEAIKTQLLHEPLSVTRNRKILRPSDLAEWELRIGVFRVFYDVDEVEQIVSVRALGHKQGSQLLINGKEFDL